MLMCRLKTDGGKQERAIPRAFRALCDLYNSAINRFLPSFLSPRRTPLDDAIEGRHWMCAKLLHSFGANHTEEITPAVREAMEAVSIDEITLLVKNEKVGLVAVQELSLLSLKISFLPICFSSCCLPSFRKRSRRRQGSTSGTM